MREQGSIGEQVKIRREILGYTQEKLGRFCGVTKSQISKIEKGKTAILRRLQGLAEALQCTLRFLPLGAPLDEASSQQEEAGIGQFIKEYQLAIGGENIVAQFWAKTKFSWCAADIHRLIASDEFEFLLQEHDIVMKKLYTEVTQPGDLIQAVSWDEKDEWEDAEQGDRYIDFNIQAVNRGVNVERIFLYRDSSELNNLKGILNWQQGNGIQVRIADTKKLRAVHHQNRLIISTKNNGKLTVYPEHSGSTFVKAYVSWDKKRTEEFERIYQTIRSSSKEWV